jgi:hypothetical protein
MGLAYLALSRQIMGMNAVLNHTLPALPWMEPALARLPGMRPVLDDAWTVQTETFAAQMAARDRLIVDAAPVHALLPAGQAAAEEVYALMLARLRGTPGYAVTDASVTRPDGVGAPLRPDAPLQTLADPRWDGRTYLKWCDFVLSRLMDVGGKAGPPDDGDSYARARL